MYTCMYVCSKYSFGTHYITYMVATKIGGRALWSCARTNTGYAECGERHNA